MDEEGQIEPIEITPGYLVICGHLRIEAAKRLGWTEISAWIRRDLAEAGDEAVEKRLIEGNLVRRQLTDLDCARARAASRW